MNCPEICSQERYFLLCYVGCELTFLFNSKRIGYLATAKERLVILLLWSAVIETILKIFLICFSFFYGVQNVKKQIW